MSLRHTNKRAARIARDARWGLVHAAGCTEPNCATREVLILEPNESRNYYVGQFAHLGVNPRRISVPRSLRPVLGRWVGG